MPRCINSVSPEDSAASKSFARRVSVRTVRPFGTRGELRSERDAQVGTTDDNGIERAGHDRFERDEADSTSGSSGKGPPSGHRSARRSSTGFTSTIGVPSMASRSRTRMRVP